MLKFCMLVLSFCCTFHVSADYIPKIYDCFPFYNELEVLEIKLNELYDHIDYFVIVEATETFRGDPKPLYFDENKQRFCKFSDKIIHIIVTEHTQTGNPWKRERFQRNQALRGLTGCNDDDIIIIGDLDEIIRASKLPEIIAPLLENRQRFVRCIQTFYSYFLNRLGPPSLYKDATGYKVNWHGSVVAKYKDVKLKTPFNTRLERYSNQGTIPNAGWHFSFMGGVDRVRDKIESFSHAELDSESFKNQKKILDDIKSLKLVKIDDSFPQFVRDNIPYFTKLGLIDQ